MGSSLRGSIAIVGAADTEVGVVPGKTPTELCVQAAMAAIEDAGLDKSQVDGLITCNSFAQPILYHAEAVAEYLQIFPRYCVTANAGGGTTFSVFQQAAAVIEAGLADVIVLSMADSLRSAMTREQARRVQASTGPMGFRFPPITR